MNILRIISMGVLLISVSAQAMLAPAPGTVIDPLNHNGQFTVRIVDASLSSLQSGMPSPAQIVQTGTDLFKNKGIPVIITTTAGIAPWWALTTGTGYLILSQCGISPIILPAIAAGTGYATGQQASSLITKYLNGPYLYNITHAALCAACLGLSYSGVGAFTGNVLFAAAQGIGLQAALEMSTHLLKQKQSNPAPEKQTNSWYSLSQEVKQGIVDGTLNTLNTMIPGLCLSMYQHDELLRILLYEQAYRLAHAGCEAAQIFLQK